MKRAPPTNQIQVEGLRNTCMHGINYDALYVHVHVHFIII